MHSKMPSAGVRFKKKKIKELCTLKLESPATEGLNKYIFLNLHINILNYIYVKTFVLMN